MTFGFLARQHAVKIMHHQNQVMGEIFEILIMGAGLRPRFRPQQALAALLRVGELFTEQRLFQACAEALDAAARLA